MRVTIRELWLVCMLGALFFGFHLLDMGSVWTKPIGASISRRPWGMGSETDAVVEDEFNKNSRLEWGRNPVPETKVRAHLSGMTLFDNLYIMKGIYYIVTEDPTSIPPRLELMSLGKELALSQEEDARTNQPTEEHIKIIGVDEAARIFGTGVNRFDGVTFMQTDHWQFLKHFFHFVIEVAAHVQWRIYSILDPNISSTGATKLPFPRRFLFPNTDSVSWQDKAELNVFFMRSAFPSCSLHFSDFWAEISSTGAPYVFDRIVIGDRAAWHRKPNIKDPAYVYPFKLSDHWWAPVRQSIVEFSAGDRNITWGAGPGERPVILYISRQKAGRRLIKEHHESLVKECKELERLYGYEFIEAYMEHLPKAEQVFLASRATILLGIHGNGLSNAMYMKPNPRSTVIEIYYPPGFAWDYHYTAWSFGIRHYGVWNDTHFTKPVVPPLTFPDGFHGDNIPVDGKTVARLIHSRLKMDIDVDDASDHH